MSFNFLFSRLWFLPLRCFRRIALERDLNRLLAEQEEIPTEICLTQSDKEAAIEKARRSGALANSLTRYAGKVRGPARPLPLSPAHGYSSFSCHCNPCI